jgi:hypothetical protein
VLRRHASIGANSQKFLHTSTDVLRLPTIVTVLVARLHLHKHRRSRLSHCPLLQLLKGVVLKLQGRRKSLGTPTMHLTLTHMMDLDRSTMTNLLYRLMCQLRTKRYLTCQDHRLMSLHLQLPKHLERWEPTASQTQATP